jgi:hypothetical protein
MGVVVQAVLAFGFGVWLIARERNLQKRQATVVNVS